MSKPKIAKRVEAIRTELNKPIPEHLAQKEKPMAEKKSAAKKKKPAKKKVARKKVAKKKSTGRKAAAASADTITLSELADEAGITGQSARQKLRAADISRPEGQRWGWSPKSKELTKVRKALGI